MSFNSLTFAFFLPIFLIIYYVACRSESKRDLVLLVGSYIFYMSWYWQYAGLIALSTVVDYTIGQKLKASKSPKKRKLLLVSSLFVNLGLLALFKYYNFFYGLSDNIFQSIGLELPELYHQLLLPVGISFYTFQTLSYTIDVYRNKIDTEESFIKFAVFVSFFPQLVAGPIVRAKDFLPQLRKKLVITVNDIERGLQLIFLGLFKKIIIADLLAYMIVDPIFSNPNAYSSFDLMIGLYAYAFQIYCDFSGYTDIAIGIALLIGFRLPINFNMPYISQTPSEFWQRWHISLSSWLRDYLYISLGGNRGTKIIVFRNLMVTMLLGGLWHGAGMNFILWGGFHGLMLVLTRGMKTETTINTNFILKVILNFHLILFSWLLFRISNLDDFFLYINGIAQLSGGTALQPLSFFILAIAFISHYIPSDFLERMKHLFQVRSLVFKAGTYTGMLMLFVGASTGAETFIYFQF